MTLRLALAVALWTLSWPLAAQGPKGIAFVQAPELGSGMCMADNPEAGFACAVEKCRESGAQDADCIRTNWCQPAGWSVDVFLLHNEGIHWHEISCGWAEQSLAMQAATAICDRDVRQFIVDCSVVQVYDPDGNPQLK